MKITIEMLKVFGACSEGIKDFCEKFPKGGEYQEVLNTAW